MPARPRALFPRAHTLFLTRWGVSRMGETHDHQAENVLSWSAPHVNTVEITQAAGGKSDRGGGALPAPGVKKKTHALHHHP